jgi:hypothetical protein
MLPSIISRATTSVKINSHKRELANSSSSDSDSNDNGNQPSSSIGHNHDKHTVHNKYESLDEGTFAFMHWMNSEDKKSLTSDNPIILLRFVNDKRTILYDTDLHSEVDVEIDNGVPNCKYCKADDCSHVGFAVCVEQSYGHRRGSEREETVENIILDD